MTRRRRARPEQQIQRALVSHLQLRAHPDVFFFHPANGGARSPIEGAILRACGVRAGVPDLILLKSGKTFGLELKAEGGRVSDAQKTVLEQMRAAGAKTAICVGIDEALAQLERWQLLKGKQQ
jgi:hypothetical protein